MKMHPFYITVPIETGQAGSRADDILWRSIIDSGTLLSTCNKKAPYGSERHGSVRSTREFLKKRSRYSVWSVLAFQICLLWFCLCNWSWIFLFRAQIGWCNAKQNIHYTL